MLPNVVLIVADDMGVGDLGCSGNEAARTPTIDACARDGTVLAEHYSGAPVCSPGRAALITGRYPHRTGVIDTREVRGLSRLSRREVTLPERLRRAGYATGLIGKWHLGSVGEAYAPHNRGFDEFTGLLGGASDYWDYYLSSNGHIERGNGTYLTDRLTAEAIDFVQRHHREAFFLEVAYNAPHVPLQAPYEALSVFADKPLSDQVKAAYAMISVMDAGIGRIMQTLADLRVLEHTAVIITSDHGPDMSGTPQLREQPTPEFARDNGGLRGSKGVVYEGGIRVPAIVHWPGGLGAARVTHQPTHHIDVVPTLLDMAGVLAAQQHVRNDPPLDGQTILGALRGDALESDRTLAWQWNRYQPVARCNAAVRRGPWKLVWPALTGSLVAMPEDSAADRLLDTPNGAHPLQPYSAEIEREVAAATDPMLFNLATDPGETDDVASDHPDLAAQLVGELDAWFAEVEAERAAVVAAGLCD